MKKNKANKMKEPNTYIWGAMRTFPRTGKSVAFTFDADKIAKKNVDPIKPNTQLKKIKKIKEFFRPKNTEVTTYSDLLMESVKKAFKQGHKRGYQKGYRAGKKAILNKIDPFDLVEDCHPDCTPVEHAFHEGTWKAHLHLERILEQIK